MQLSAAHTNFYANPAQASHYGQSYPREHSPRVHQFRQDQRRIDERQTLQNAKFPAFVLD
jgi:hypothetical protein